MKKVLLVIVVILPFIMNGCYYDNFGEVNPVVQDSCIVPDTVSYANDIAPIITSSCGPGNANCHSGAGVGAPLGSYVALTSEIANESDFMDRINRTTTSDKWMPKDLPKLTDCKIQKIQRWIDQGQRDN